MLEEVKRGQIYWVNWSPGRGSEQTGIRPALIIQNHTGNKFSPTTIVASMSTAPEKTFPFLVKVTAKESGLSQYGVVNLAQILTVDKTCLGDKCGQLSSQKMLEVDRAIKISLGIID